MSLYLMTATDKNYYEKILPYVDTLNKNSPADFTYLFTIGFQPEYKYQIVKQHFLPETVFSNITTNPCVQAGEWLPKFLSCSPTDVIIFTDGDMRLQRKFTNDELDWVENIKEGEVLAGPNATHSENTLLNELSGLRTNWNTSDVFELFKNEGIRWEEKTLNMGVLICTYSTYWEIFTRTYKLFHKYPTITEHMARQQWFMNLAIYSFAKVGLLPFTFHSHVHNGVQAGLNFKNGETYIDNTKILFSHKFHEYV